jgi:hypothetical protein
MNTATGKMTDQAIIFFVSCPNRPPTIRIRPAAARPIAGTMPGSR